MGLYQLTEIRWSGCGLHLASLYSQFIGDPLPHWKPVLRLKQRLGVSATPALQTTLAWLFWVCCSLSKVTASVPLNSALQQYNLEVTVLHTSVMQPYYRCMQVLYNHDTIVCNLHTIVRRLHEACIMLQCDATIEWTDTNLLLHSDVMHLKSGSVWVIARQVLLQLS